MQILSALDAVSPAIARTRLVLFSPFRLGRTWKLSVCAYLAFAGTLYMPFPLMYLALVPTVRQAGADGAVPWLIGALIVATVLFGLVFYLCSRLEFAFFDIVLNRGEFVAPAWRKYSSQATRWTAAKIGLGILATAAMAAPLTVYARHFAVVMQQMSALKPGAPPPPEFFTEVFAGYGIVLLLGGAVFLVMATVDSFIVPSLALEDVSLAEAFRRLGSLWRREPAQLLAFVAIKAGVGVAGYMGLIFALEVAVFVIVLVLGALLGVAGLILHLLHVPTPLLIGVGIFIAVVFYIAAIVYGMAIAIGPLFTFTQAYTLYFLGGRYPLVGDLLERSTPLPAAHAYAPPPIYSPAAYGVAEPAVPPIPPGDPHER
jgi:hypothetical protein